MDFKRIDAPTTTVTYNKAAIEAPTNNIYEAISIIAKRATQINAEIKRRYPYLPVIIVEIKKELVEKLEAFATNNDNLEEIFENKEQIEVSRFYERLPKPQAIAVKEWLEGKVYFRETE